MEEDLSYVSSGIVRNGLIRFAFLRSYSSNIPFFNCIVSSADRAMSEYVEKLTLKPWEMVEADVVTLPEAGFSDLEGIAWRERMTH